MTNPRSVSRVAPWLLLSPFLILFALFFIYPVFQSFILSLEQSFGPAHTTFVGGANYADLLRDPLFFKAVGNTVLYTLGSVFIQLPLALGLALLLNRPGLRGRNFLRAAYFAPVMVGVVFVAVIFGVLFEKRTGLINQTLHATIGWDLEFPWLSNYVMAALIVATLWQYVGFNMVYFLGALQNVRKDLVEASILDGAGPWSRFVHVIVPQIRPVASFVVLLSIVGSFQLFELPWVLLAGPGPNDRGLTIVMYLYIKGFGQGDLGYASAVGWLLATMLMVFALLQRRLAGDTSREATR
ncbi:MAG: sugar ABC transporter permease [Phycisphaerales bacterium]|nr:sugar ABC transporter permease [Phycisphaerales bacterium]